MCVFGNFLETLPYKRDMRGYVNVPRSIYCKPCKECGSRPVIALVEEIGYIVKCSKDDRHYQTMPGLIDIEDWNSHNTIQTQSNDYSLSQLMAW
jgi:hypothetical protein